MKRVLPLVLLAGLAAETEVHAAPVTPQQAALQRWYKLNQTAEVLVSNFPFDMVFDGEHMWISTFAANTVDKVRAADMAPLGSFAVGQRPVALAYDGENIWSANQTDGTVTRFRASDGAN